MKSYILFPILSLAQFLLISLTFGSSLAGESDAFSQTSSCTSLHCEYYQLGNTYSPLTTTTVDYRNISKVWLGVVEDFVSGNGLNPSPHDLGFYYENTPIKLQAINDQVYFSIELNFKF